MCEKCRKHAKYWLHIADSWTEEEKEEMRRYLSLKASDLGERLERVIETNFDPIELRLLLVYTDYAKHLWELLDGR